MKVKLGKLSLFLLLIMALSACSTDSTDIKPVVEKGVLKLSAWNFEKDGVLPLNGEWEFYWKKLLTPQDFIQSKIKKDTFINVPGYWNGYKIGNEIIKGKGYATMRLLVESPEENNTLSMEELDFMTSSKTWINGIPLIEQGIVANNENDAEPDANYIIRDFKLNKGINEIVIQISNFSHRHGGTYSEINIGNTEQFLKKRRTSTAFDLFLVGSIFIMAIYHLGLFYLRRKDKSALYFAIFAFLLAFRTLIIRDHFILEIFPNMGWLLKMRFEYYTLLLSPAAIGMFLLAIYPDEFKKIPIYIMVSIGVLCSLFVTFAKPFYFSLLVTPFQIVLLLLIVYIVYGLILAIKRKRDGAVIFFLGSLAIAFATVNDMLYVAKTIKTIELIPWGIFIFIFSQSYVIAIRFSAAFVRTEELTEELDFQNKNLEKIVDKRTIEIQQQNEEILAQKEELLAMNDELSHLVEELEKLSIIARETDNAIVIMSPEGKFEWMNEASTRLYGYNFREYIEKFGDNIFEASSSEKVNIAFEECIITKKSVAYESYFVSKNNNKLWMQTTLTPIISSDDKVLKIIGIDTDITKLKAFQKEILEKNDEISAQKDLLQKVNETIERQNDQIKSSIRYANTIQQAILPDSQTLDKYFDNFIIFMPKDIVSGDFYWTNALPAKPELNLTDKKYVAAVDCTGHGVPGAFMSMIANRLLSEIVNERHILQPSEILTQLNLAIRKALKQDKSENKDGMDMALCMIETDFNGKQKLTFAGAKRPVLFYSKQSNELSVFKTTRKSIGGYVSRFNKSEFSQKTVDLNKGDIIYLSTDGFTDQNNENRERYGTVLFVEFLAEHVHEKMETQKELLLNELNKLLENTNQRDDITVLGIKII